MVNKRFGCGFGMGSEIQAQPFEILTNGRHFVKNHLKSGLKHPDFKWSGFWMVGTIAITIAKTQPFDNRTIWNPTYKKSRFQMVGFQIPSVDHRNEIKSTTPTFEIYSALPIRHSARLLTLWTGLRPTAAQLCFVLFEPDVSSHRTCKKGHSFMTSLIWGRPLVKLHAWKCKFLCAGIFEEPPTS